jgi:deazaflavin-dependent oxidoreductase (nitroreductase family)
MAADEADKTPSTYVPPDLTLFGEEHIRQYRATDGAVGYEWNGATCLLLTTTGRKSGQPRTQALIFSPSEDACVVVASHGGAPTHPSWYLNLVANPEVHVQVKGDRFAARARTAEGEERTKLWKLMTVNWPNYDEYIKRTDRVIPVVVLERIPG